MLTSLNSLPFQTLLRVIVAFSAVVITLLAIRLIEPTEARNVVRYGGYFFTFSRECRPCRVSSFELSLIIGLKFLPEQADDRNLECSGRLMGSLCARGFWL